MGQRSGRIGRTTRMTGSRVVPIALVLGLVAMAGCSGSADRRVVEGEIESRTEGTFYEPPSPLAAGQPGALIRSEDLFGAPDGSRAWRILYHSTDVTGADIAVSGVVLAPDGDAGRGDRPIVSWGHPTTGAAERCAPSLGVDPFILIEGLHELLSAGYVVVATDYSGMGAPGPDSYLIGTTEGRNVLDAARAAREVKDAGAGSRLLLWGHSQGGQAALFAAQEAPTYAPDLHLQAVAVAAPAVELGALLDDDIVDDSGVTLGAYSFAAYASVYGPKTPGLDLSTILTPAGVDAVPKMVDLCLLGQHDQLHAIAGPLVGGFLKADPATVEPWSTLLTQNTPGAVPVQVPMLVAQGLSDELVKPATTEAYAAHLCATGEHLDFRTYRDVGHGTVAERALLDVLPFFSDALAARPTRTTCSSS
jgi:alpha-beta hydrolase superfamily lysophospholipase